MKEEIIVTYVYHSCYTVEIGEYFIIFDYYKGILNIPKDKKVIFISTHRHEDHYTSEILKVPDMNKNTYILSYDIAQLETNDNIIYIKDNKLGVEQLKSLYNSSNIHFIKPDKNYNIKLVSGESIHVKTFGSTDQGISLLIYIDDIAIFHAGDLNYRAWPDNDDATMKHEYDIFIKEIEKIKKEPLDLAFFPLDYRLEENYYKGADIFIKEVKPQLFFPMHSGSHEDISVKFNKEHKYEDTVVREIYQANQKIIIDIKLE